MAAQAQHEGLKVGMRLDLEGSEDVVDDPWPGAKAVFEVLEWIFGSVFLLELIMKAVVLRLAFLREAWNWLDTVICVFWVISSIGPEVFPLEPMVLRLARLARLLRMLRLVRAIRAFDSLYLMITAVKSSISALGWSVALLFVVQMVIALFLHQMLGNYWLDNEAYDEESRFEVFRYFGSFSKAMLTMFEFMLANWPPASRSLTENVSEWYLIFVLAYQLIITFALGKVIMGVFLQVTFHVASSDDTIMLNQQDRTIANHVKKIKRLFDAADEDGNGLLDREEFKAIIDDQEVVKWLSAMGVDLGLFAQNADTLYDIMLGDAQALSADAFVKGMSKMRGHARSIELALLQQENQRHEALLREVRHAHKAARAAVADAQQQRKAVPSTSPKPPSTSSSRRKRRNEARGEARAARAPSPPSSPVGIPSRGPSPPASPTSPDPPGSPVLGRPSSAPALLGAGEPAPPEEPPKALPSPGKEAWPVARGSVSSAGSMASVVGSRLSARDSAVRPAKCSTASAESQHTISGSLFRKGSTGSRLGEKDDPPRIAERVVRSTAFEATFVVVILLNAVVMACEAQYQSIDDGCEIEYPGMHRAASDMWPWAKTAFRVLDFVFGCLYVVELLLKLAGWRCEFFKDPWNWLDIVIISFWIPEAINSGGLPFDPMFLRLARLARIMRLLRLVKAMRGSAALYVILASLKGTFYALLWSIGFLAVTQMLIALILQTSLEGFVMDRTKLEEDRREVFRYFGTFTKSMLSMFELTLANWIPVARTLTEQVSEWLVIVVLAHKLVVGVAVVMVITGVFLQETFKVASEDNFVMLSEKEQAIKVHTEKMSRLFMAADADQSGYLDKDEFLGIVGDPVVGKWLAAMGLQVSDASALFDMIDDGDEQLTAEELVKGVSRMKGPARAIEISVLLHRSRRRSAELRRLKQEAEELHALAAQGLRASPGLRELGRSGVVTVALKEEPPLA
uniref:EF-hand domain-containing protein n=1 Tax=Pyrodinium bahamense TaxID=73915 RepID=A0A7S0AHN1_9DINO